MSSKIGGRSLFLDDFDPEPIRDFDGRQWGGVRLDDMTRDEFKRRYNTKSGKFIRSEATIVSVSSRAPWDIQALQDGNKGDSRITGFYVAFRNDGMRLDRTDLDPRDGEEYFPRRRFSDWSVWAFPRRGIAFMVVKEGDDRVPYALLTTRERLQRMLDQMDRSSSRIEDIRDEFDELKRDVEVGFVSVSIIRNDIRPRNENRFTEDLRLQAEAGMNRGDLRFRVGGKGTLLVNVSVSFRDGDNFNRVDVSLQLNAMNERGKVTASTTGFGYLDKSRNRSEDRLESAARLAMLSALNNLPRQVERQISGQKAPSPAEYRSHQFVSLIDAPTK
jgi:hypothetical protein